VIAGGILLAQGKPGNLAGKRLYDLWRKVKRSAIRVKRKVGTQPRESAGNYGSWDVDTSEKEGARSVTLRGPDLTNDNSRWALLVAANNSGRRVRGKVAEG